MYTRHAVALALGLTTLILAACGGDDEPTPPTQAFTLSVTPATLSIQAGASGALNVSVSRSGGFDGAIAIAVEGLPTGVTAQALSIAANATTGTLTLTAAANAAAASATLTIRGTGTGVSPQTQSVTLTITAAPGFTLAVTPATVSIAAGQSGSATANITRAGGFTGAVNLTSSGAPTGVTVAFTPASVTGGSAAIAVNVAASVAAGSYPVTIQGSGTGVSNQSATLTVTVTVPVTPTIALAVAPATVSIQQGQQGTSALTITRTNFTGAVALAASGAPTGMTVSFNPASVTATTSTVTVDVGATVALGNHAITITGTGTGVADATTTLTVTVTAAPASSISLAIAPTTLSIQAGASGTANLTLARTNFTADVALTSSGAPTGMTITLNPATLSGTTLASTVTVDVGAAVAAGDYPITLQGAGTGVANATTTLTVTVTAAAGSISLAVAPTTLSVQAGASGTANVTLTRTNFTADVNLTSSGAPTGVTVAFNPATLAGATLASVATVTVGAAVAAGTYPITFQGAGTGVSNATTTLMLTVTAAAGSITLTTNPTALSLAQGASGTTALAIARTNFTGTVNLTSSGAPGGVTVSFNPASTTANASTVTVNVGAAVAPGTYQITLQGAGTGISNATVTLSLTVTQSGGGSGNVTFTFCQITGLPIWFAYSSNGGAWTQVTGTNNVYSFNITTRGIVAWVVPAPNAKTTLNIVYGTQQELEGRGSNQCNVVAPGTKTINGTAAGVNAGELAQIAMAGGVGTVIGGVGNTFQLTGVRDGLADLIGAKGAISQAGIATNSIVIQRDLNVANNGNVSVDFAQGLTPLSRTTTIGNLGTQQAAFAVIFSSKNGTVASLSTDAPGASATRTWGGVPDANTVAGDLHLQSVTALNSPTSPFPYRQALVYNRLATSQTINLANAMTPPTVTVAGTSPYVTVNSSWAIESAYNLAWSMSYAPASGSVESVQVSGTPGYFGSGPVQLSIPTFGAGFNPVHGLQPGIEVTWIFIGSGGSGFTAGPSEGAVLNSAAVSGTFTP